MRLVFLSLGLLLVSAIANAHHSITSYFDPSSTIVLRGVVVDFKLRSPHSSFVVDATVYVDGVAQSDTLGRWEVESHSVPVLRRAGLNQDTFQAGDKIEVVAWKNRNPDFPFVFGTTFTTEEGTVFGEERIVEGSSGSGLVTGIQRIAGRWRSPGYLNGDESPLPLNEAGLAAWGGYDPKLSPASTCESQSIPGVFHAPYIFEIQINGEEVILRNEAYNVIRTVKIDGEPALANPSGVFGVANARVVDGSLVVESRDYPPSGWGLGIATHLNGGGADVPSSRQKTVEERYSISDDGQTLFLNYTLTDPMYLTAPHDGLFELARVADDTAIYPYECEVESATMFTRQPED